MSNNKKHKILLFIGTILIALGLFALFNKYYSDQSKDIKLNVQLQSDKVDEYSVYYDVDGKKNWNDIEVVKVPYTETGSFEKLVFSLPKEAKNIKIVFGNSEANINIKEMYFKGDAGKSTISYEQIKNNGKNIIINQNEGQIVIQSKGSNSEIQINDLEDWFTGLNEKPGYLTILIGILSIVLGFITASSLFQLKNAIELIKDCYKNRGLVGKLAKNDFKTRYASSYLGIVWGFIQPLVTIMVYWFVFQVGFRSRDVGDAPFILWFIAGIIPWFYFSDCLSSATNVFLEYSYLVKKVVFKIEILPTVKIVASLFVHCFFILFIFIIMTVYGYYPSAHSLQFLYYSICMIVLVYSVSFFTSAVVLFFRDLSQIVVIILNVGFWVTPIGWNIEMLSEFWGRFFKLNPMYYIVTGYRDSFIEKIYIWQRPYQTIYFWAFCLVTLLLGVKIFKKLKPHFSDVL